MIYINLDYKCPHCGSMNSGVSAAQTTGPAYLQDRTGNDANYGDKSVQFLCGFCQTTASYEIQLRAL